MSKIESRKVLKENLLNPSTVLKLADELNAAFKKQFKRNPNCSLVYSESGSIKKPKYDLVIWCDTKDSEEVKWFKQQISGSDSY